MNDLFGPRPRRPRRVLMHVTAAGCAPDGSDIAQFECRRCGHETDWQPIENMTAAKRGIPCPNCNREEVASGQ